MTSPPSFHIENLRRHDLGEGRSFWAAEVLAEGARAGVHQRFGSWVVYELTDGGELTRSPFDAGPLREVRFPVAKALVEAVTAETGTAAPKVRR